MPSFIIDPQKVSGLVYSGPGQFIRAHVVDVCGLVARHVEEDPDNAEGIPGLPAIPAGFRFSLIQEDGYRPLTCVVSNAEPYALADGQTIEVSIDGGPVQTVTLSSGDFVDIGAATNDEFAAAISAALTGGGARTIRGRVAVYTDTFGPLGSVQVTGGTANGAVGLPTTVVYGFPSSQNDHDWTILDMSQDDAITPAIVVDPAQTPTDPSPTLRAIAGVLEAL